MGLSTLPLNHWMSIPYGQLSNSLRAVFPLVSTITSAISPKWMLQTLKTSHFSSNNQSTSGYIQCLYTIDIYI